MGNFKKKTMIVKEKIILTLITVIGMLILMKMMRFINNRLKSNLLKSNPKLVTNASWFFSDKKKIFIDCLIIGMAITIIAMVWFD
jgi:hypothetical protein